MMTACRRGMQRCAAVSVTRARQLRVSQQQLLNCIDISSAAGLDKSGDSFPLSILDVRFQCSPTGKTVIAGYVQQCLCEFGLGIGAPERLQALLRELLEELERCTFGTLRVR